MSPSATVARRSVRQHVGGTCGNRAFGGTHSESRADSSSRLRAARGRLRRCALLCGHCFTEARPLSRLRGEKAVSPTGGTARNLGQSLLGVLSVRRARGDPTPPWRRCTHAHARRSLAGDAWLLLRRPQCLRSRGIREMNTPPRLLGSGFWCSGAALLRCDAALEEECVETWEGDARSGARGECLSSPLWVAAFRWPLMLCVLRLDVL